MADKTIEIRCAHGTTRQSAADHLRKVIAYRRDQYASYIHSLRHAPFWSSVDITGRGFEARLEFDPSEVILRIHLKSLPLKWLARSVEREARAALEKELPVERFGAYQGSHH